MNSRLILVAVILLAVSGLRCSNAEEPAIPTNLLANGDFEHNGAPSFNGWDGYEWSAVDSSTEVPPGDGKYSAKLYNLSSGAGILRTAVPASQGSHVYRLSAWGKSDRRLIGGGSGWANLFLIRSDSVVAEISIGFPDTVWMTKSIGTTFTAQAGDSVWVVLRGAQYPNAWGFSFFDRVSLEVE